MNKKNINVSLLASIIVAVLIVAAAAMCMQNSGIAPFSKATIVAYAAGTPDALGNRIDTVYFYQNATGSWAQVATLSYSDYVLNYNLTIPANQHTIVFCSTRLNYSLAPDVATSMARTRVYLTISGVVSSASMLSFGGTNYGSSYWLDSKSWPSATFSSPTSTWIPATDTTYTITFQYQAYY